LLQGDTCVASSGGGSSPAQDELGFDFADMIVPCDASGT
jgi:hypothetical protein